MAAVVKSGTLALVAFLCYGLFTQDYAIVPVKILSFFFCLLGKDSRLFTACLQEMRALSQISRSLMEHHSGNGSSSAGFFDPGYDKLSKLEFLEAWRALKENHEYHILVDKVASVSESKVIAALHCQNIMGTAVKSLRDRVRA